MGGCQSRSNIHEFQTTESTVPAPAGSVSEDSFCKAVVDCLTHSYADNTYTPESLENIIRIKRHHQGETEATILMRELNIPIIIIMENERTQNYKAARTAGERQNAHSPIFVYFDGQGKYFALKPKNTINRREIFQHLSTSIVLNKFICRQHDSLASLYDAITEVRASKLSHAVSLSLMTLLEERRRPVPSAPPLATITSEQPETTVVLHNDAPSNNSP